MPIIEGEKVLIVSSVILSLFRFYLKCVTGDVCLLSICIRSRLIRNGVDDVELQSSRIDIDADASIVVVYDAMLFPQCPPTKKNTHTGGPGKSLYNR